MDKGGGVDPPLADDLGAEVLHNLELKELLSAISGRETLTAGAVVVVGSWRKCPI